MTYRIDGYENEFEYTSDQLTKIGEILQGIETEQKRFSLKYNPEEVKKAFTDIVEALFYETEEETTEEDSNGKSRYYEDYYKEHYEDLLVENKKGTIVRFVKTIAAITVVGLVAPVLLPKAVAPMVIAGAKIIK